MMKYLTLGYLLLVLVSALPVRAALMPLINE